MVKRGLPSRKKAFIGYIFRQALYLFILTLFGKDLKNKKWGSSWLYAGCNFQNSLSYA
jgi:hypothetical protein